MLFPEGVPEASGYQPWVGAEIDPQLTAGGYVDGPDVTLEGVEHPSHLDLNPALLPTPAERLAAQTPPPTTPVGVLLLMNGEAFEGSFESSIRYYDGRGFFHYPQEVSGPQEPEPTFDPSVYGPGAAWPAIGLADGVFTLDHPAEHLCMEILLIFAPDLLPSGC